MKVKLVGTILTVGAASTMIAACSGGSGGGSSVSTISAQFIDAPVKGLPFVNASGKENVTGDAGKFSCVRGEFIQFKIKDLDLGYAPCGDKIFVQDLIQIPGNTWEKAAALIQSFSVSNDDNTLLDLSNTKLADINTTAISSATNDNDFQAALSSAVTSYKAANQTSTITSKTITDATNHANSSLSKHNKLDADFSDALREMAGEPFALKATRTSGDRKFCFDHIAAKAYIVGTTSFVFQTESAAGSSHENLFDITRDNSISCTAPQVGTNCEVIPPERLPKDKIITGPHAEMISRHLAEIPILVENTPINLDVEETIRFTLTASAAQSGITASGSLIIDQKVLTDGSYKGTTNQCVYKVTSAPIQ